MYSNQELRLPCDPARDWNRSGIQALLPPRRYGQLHDLIYPIGPSRMNTIL